MLYAVLVLVHHMDLSMGSWMWEVSFAPISMQPEPKTLMSLCKQLHMRNRDTGG